jgi:hypothetical protein
MLGRPARGKRWMVALIAALALSAFAAPGNAGATMETGLADSEPATFDSPLLGTMNVDRFRVIVPWDIATRGSTHQYYDRRQEFELWLAKFVAFRASHPGATFNVGFERSNIGEPNSPMLGHAPTESQFRNAFSSFVSAYGAHKPYMRIDPWNEPNYSPSNASRVRTPSGTAWLDDEDGGTCNSGSPSVSSCGPRLAAFYYRWARDECDDCHLEAGEFAGGASWDYIQKYKHHIGDVIRPPVWGVHNYGDVTRYQAVSDNTPDELKTFIREIFCTNTSDTGVALGTHHCNSSTNWGGGSQIWVTATGAGHSFACDAHPTFPGCNPGVTHVVKGQQNQCDAVAWMMRWEDVDSRVNRVYHYTYMDGNNPANSDDTGVVNAAGTTPRLAYNILKHSYRAC